MPETPEYFRYVLYVLTHINVSPCAPELSMYPYLVIGKLAAMRLELDVQIYRQISPSSLQHYQ